VPEEIVIDRRFNGPPGTANGGYACGLLARLIDGPAAVTLRRPPPLGVPLAIERRAGGIVVVRSAEGVVAEAEPARFDAELPDPVTPEQAEAASASYIWFEGHPFPGCFVCGPGRAVGDGLRVFPGPVPGRNVVAAPFVADDAALGDQNGVLRPEIVWAALDCPSGVAVYTAEAMTGVALLGRLEANLIGPLRVGERYVAVGWHVRTEGRKAFAGSALFTDVGELRAVAQATWIRLA